MKRKIYLITALFLIGGSTLVYILNTNPLQNYGETNQLKRISELIALADSVRNSEPDKALNEYHQVIALLQKHGKGKDESHLLADAYVGLANVYSNSGDYTLALENDSIAMETAHQNNDKPMIAKAFVAKGLIYLGLGEYETALGCFQEAWELAIELKDLKLQAKIYSNRAKIYSSQGEFEKAIDGFTQALNIGKTLNDDDLIAGNTMNLGVVYKNTGERDSALVKYNTALRLFQKTGDKNGVLLCYQNIGTIHFYDSNYAAAIENYGKSKDLALEMKDQPNAGKAYQNIGEVYTFLGDYKVATDNYYNSLKIKEKLGDKHGLLRTYSSLGNLHYLYEEYPKAIDFYRQSLKLGHELDYAVGAGKAYSGIANVFSELHQSDSARVYYFKALDYYDEDNDKEYISNLYANLGDEYCNTKQYDLAVEYLQKSLQLKIQLSQEDDKANVLLLLAELFLKQAKADPSNYEKAEGAALEAYQIAAGIGIKPYIKQACEVLKNIYKAQGQPEKALEYFEMYKILNDSLFSEDKTEALASAEARWNVERKQQEIDNLENTRKLNEEIIERKEAESRQQKIIIWSVVSLFLLSVISVTIGALYIRKKREALYQKQLANMTALRMQNARNIMSPHFFFNILASLSGLSNQPERLKEKLGNLSLLLRKVVENIDRTAVSLEEELAAVKAYVDLYRDKINGSFTVEYTMNDAKLQESVPAMIIQIPVENAIKHGLMPLDGEKKLTIGITDCNHYQQITITDNGIGLKASAGRSSGTGTGLKTLLQTIHLLNANNERQINFSVAERESGNAIATGTVVEIEIPNNFNYTV